MITRAPRMVNASANVSTILTPRRSATVTRSSLINSSVLASLGSCSVDRVAHAHAAGPAARLRVTDRRAGFLGSADDGAGSPVARSEDVSARGQEAAPDRSDAAKQLQLRRDPPRAEARWQRPR